MVGKSPLSPLRLMFRSSNFEGSPDTLQYPGCNPEPSTKLNSHESLCWKRAFERVGFLPGKPVSWIVVGVPNDDDDLLTSTSQQLQSVPNQSSTYSLTLMLWKDGYRRQRNRRYQTCRGPNPHPAEHDTSLPERHRQNGD
jgi:hypothetical protein